MITHVPTPTVLLENGSMVHDSNKRRQKQSDRANNPLFWLEIVLWLHEFNQTETLQRVKN